MVGPGPIAALDVRIEPDLSNAAPFLAAAAITGGSVSVADWPSYTHQPGDAIRDVLSAFGADVDFDEHGLTVRGTNKITGVDLDLRGASELTPVVAAVAALATGTSHCTASPTSAATRPTGWPRWRPNSTAWAATCGRPRTA